jgi:metal-responsive CopG/Arc/MetJ family transcriptional regulator
MKTIQITIDEKLLAQVDELARRQGLNRSALVSESLQRSLHGANIRRLQEEPIATYVAQPNIAEPLRGDPAIQDALSSDLVMLLEHLFPGRKLEEIVTELLLDHTERQLVALRSMAQQFEEKYAESFDAFRSRTLANEPNEAAEQDYFDWEMAVTASENLVNEIEQLRQRQQQS